jgi:hypothetical protein
MASMLAVRYDDRAVKALAYQARHLRGGLAAIVPPALNRTNRWSRTRIKREVAKRAKLKVRRADRLLKSTKAGRGRWRAEVAVENRRIGIGKFVKGRSRRRRVTAAFPSGLTQSYPRSFRARMPSGHKGVFVRARVVRPGAAVRRVEHVGRGKAGWYKYTTELPIYEERERLGRVIRMDFLRVIQREGGRQLRKEIAARLRWKLRQRYVVRARRRGR